MAKVLLKRLWPERKIALDGVVYTDIYKADGEADIPAIGDPMTTPATCFTPLAYPIEFTKNHPDVPGKRLSLPQIVGGNSKTR